MFGSRFAECYEPRNVLQRAQRLTESVDIRRDKLIGAFDPPVEVHDGIECVLGREVQVVNVTSQSSAERDGQLLLEEADLSREKDG